MNLRPPRRSRRARLKRGTSETQTLPAALRAYLAVLLAMWGLSALPLVVRSQALWSTTSLWFDPPFFDFGCYYDRIKLLHRPEFWTAVGPTWNYPAPSIFVYQFFYLFNRGEGGAHRVFFGFLAYLIFAALVLTTAWFTLSGSARRRGLDPRFGIAYFGLALVFCWPIFFGMERGNIELFLDAGVAVGVLAYVRRRWWLAAILVGIFGSGKLYGLLLLALLLPLRRWKEFVGGAAMAVATTLSAAWWIGRAPVVAQQSQGVLHGIQSWILEYSLTLQASSVGFDHSMFGFLKLVNAAHPNRFPSMAIAYAALAGTLMLALFFGRIWSLPRPNQLLFISVGAVLLPPTSFDYTLMLLLPSWAWLTLLFVTEEGRRSFRFVSVMTMCGFGTLFAPQAFAVFHGQFFAGQVKMLVLLFLLGVSLSTPFAERRVEVMQ